MGLLIIILEKKVEQNSSVTVSENDESNEIKIDIKSTAITNIILINIPKIPFEFPILVFFSNCI